MKDAERLLVQLACIQLGIVPVDDAERAAKGALDKMSPNEAFRTKRKFRKVWRQALRQTQGNMSERNKQRIKKFVNCRRGSSPAANEIRRRRYMVLAWLRDQLKPVLNAMPNVPLGSEW